MSWQCTSWALREAPCPNASARLVLIALADRCQPDGRSAWPTPRTLMLEAHCSEATVRRALKELEEVGAIRRGNQELAKWDEHGKYVMPQHRPVVWECCMGVSLEEVALKPGRQASDERAGRAGNSSTVKMTSLENVETKPKASTVILTSLESDPQSQTGQNDYPSSVTGDHPRLVTSDRAYIETNTKQIHPPVVPPNIEAEVARDGTDGQDVSPPSDEVDANAGDDRESALSLLDELEHWQRQSKLILPERSKRDVDAVAALVALHGAKLVGEVMRFGLDDRWYKPQLTRGRVVARLFSDMHNRLVVQRPSISAIRSSGVSASYAQPADDVVRLADGLLERYGADEGNDGFECRRMLIGLLRGGMAESDALTRALQVGRERLARIEAQREQEELARERRLREVRQAKRAADAGFAGRSDVLAGSLCEEAVA